MNIGNIIPCVGNMCKKAYKLGIKFVNSVDVSVQKKIEEDITNGILSQQKMIELEKMQNDIRDKIQGHMIELSVYQMEKLLQKTDPSISEMIKNTFTYYYTDISDLIPREKKENMTDTVDDIAKLDMSNQLMYCIELICNPDDYVMNYEMHTTVTDDELEEEMKKCSIEDADNYKIPSGITGVRNNRTGVTQHIERPINPFGTGIRKRPPQQYIERGGSKRSRSKKSKIRSKRSKAKSKRSRTTSKKSKAKKSNRRTTRSTKRR